MNILLIIPENKGTIASVSYGLYLALRAQKECRVYVACLGPYAADGFLFEDCFHLNFIRGPHWLKRVSLLRRIKRKYEIERSISTLSGCSYWNVASGIGEYKIGIFHACLSQTASAGILNHVVNYLGYKLLAKRLDKKIAVNKSTLLDIQRLLGGNTELVYNIHDFGKIKRLSEQPLDNEDEEGLFSHTNVILFVGSLYRIKGPDRLFEAFIRLIRARRNDCHLVYIGKDCGNYVSDIISRSKSLGLETKVSFLGFKQNPYRYMKRAAMLVSPSRDEGLPGVLIEALSLGVKCVATNSSRGIWEIMECDDLYDANLSKLQPTKYGLIVPNLLGNEERTIDLLADGIQNCLNTAYPEMSSFDLDRFSQRRIVGYFLN